MAEWWRCIRQATRISKSKSNADHPTVEDREKQQRQAYKKEGMITKMMEKLP
jgi:alkylated DNA nucleotide flippase Atl1